MPVGAPTFREGVRVVTEVYQALKARLLAGGLATGLGDEGGFAPSLPSNEAAIELILESIQRAGYEPGADVALALDPASTELFKDGNYLLEKEGHSLSSEQLAEL